MTRVPWVAVDYDHTIKDNEANTPMAGVGEALQELRARGIRILIHSCNDPDYIRQQLQEWGIVVDGVWDGVGKPVCVAYIDDRGLRFTGDWQQTTADILRLLEGGRPEPSV